MKKLIYLLFLITTTNINLFSQNTSSIDKETKECLNKADKYIDKTNCYKCALKKWEKSIDKYNKQLSSELYLDTKELFDKAHQSWLLYKKSNFEGIEDMLSQLKGDFYDMREAKIKMDIVKNRVLELKFLYETLHQP